MCFTDLSDVAHSVCVCDYQSVENKKKPKQNKKQQQKTQLWIYFSKFNFLFFYYSFYQQERIEDIDRHTYRM